MFFPNLIQSFATSIWNLAGSIDTTISAVLMALDREVLSKTSNVIALAFL